MNGRAQFVPVLLLALASPLGAADQPAKAQPAKTLRQESRVWILRGLQSEFATLRKAAPRGEKGLPLDTQGKIDEKELLFRITNNGVALRPGEIVQITKVDFKKDAIIFDLNGGGKKKRRWFENIEVGMAGSRPMATNQRTELPTGSSIELQFGGPLPDVTVDDLKRMLTPVLDFTRRSASVIYTETLPKEIQEAIKNHQALVGMDREMVLAAKGRPERKVREQRGRVWEEDWIYGTPPSKITFVTFVGDKVVAVKEMTPGIASDAARAAEGDNPPPASPPAPAAQPASAPASTPASPPPPPARKP